MNTKKFIQSELTSKGPSNESFKCLEMIREKARKSNTGLHEITPTEITEWQDQLGPLLKLAHDQKEEAFDLIDQTGEPTGQSAPRSLVHLVGLRHRTIHLILLEVRSDNKSWLVLQQRSFSVSDFPGAFDLGCAGHVKAGLTPNQAVRAELWEELGLAPEDLKDQQLRRLIAYPFEESKPNDPLWLNLEWREVFVGVLGPDGLKQIRFADNEVGALVLVPHENVEVFLKSKVELASALLASMPQALKILRQEGSL